MITLTSVEAQNRFGQLLDTVQRETVTITRRGRVVAVMLSPQEMQDLLGANFKQVSLVEAVEAHFARGDGTKNK